jgi:hypothetical protein
MRGAVLLLAGALAACQQAGEAPAPEPSSSAPESLIGEYRVAGIDGAELTGPAGIALTIDQGHVSYQPTCAGYVWSYAYRAGALDIERRQEKLHHPPPPVCAIAVPPELDRLAAALEAANLARVTPANGIELSGGGRSVLLFSQ